MRELRIISMTMKVEQESEKKKKKDIKWWLNLRFSAQGCYTILGFCFIQKSEFINFFLFVISPFLVLFFCFFRVSTTRRKIIADPLARYTRADGVIANGGANGIRRRHVAHLTNKEVTSYWIPLSYSFLHFCFVRLDRARHSGWAHSRLNTIHLHIYARTGTYNTIQSIQPSKQSDLSVRGLPWE